MLRPLRRTALRPVRQPHLIPSCRAQFLIFLIGLIPAIVLVLTGAQGASAAPAAPIVIQLTQPDGTVFAAVVFGDEWNNGHETTEGYTILLDKKTGFWHYAIADAAGRLLPSALRPGLDAPVGLPKHLRDASRSVSPNRFPFSPSGPRTPAGASGSRKILVILASFSDRSAVGSTATDWSNAFFGATNSVKHYYEEVSYNQLHLNPATEGHGTANDGVIGWLNLGYSHPNTGSSTGAANQAIVRDALIAADPYINYAAFDTDGNNYLSTDELKIVVIVAGYEMSYGGASACMPNVWGHHWSISPQFLDGVYVGGAGYSQFGEWHQYGNCTNPASGHMATIGIMVHELGHDLGWPDLYDTDGGSEGVGNWSVMGSGSWLYTTGYAGSKPSHPDAFLKWYQGWLTPYQVTGTETGVPVQQVETNQRVIQLLNNPGGVDWLFYGHSGTGEYFLVENRQKTGYDAGLPGCGLLIWHIDETRTATNAANADETRKLVDLEEADGLNDLDNQADRGDAGDPYPGSTNRTTFNGSTNPNSNLYSGAASGVSVTNISIGCAGTMSADFSVATATPTNTPTPTPTTTPTPTATRTPTPNATPPAVATVALDAGWSLVSLPLQPSAGSIAALVAGTSPPGAVTEVWAYDRGGAACTSGTWRRYSPGASDNSLTTVDHTMGLWIRTTSPATMTVTGTIPASAQIPLCPGWNLVGYPATGAAPPETALAGLPVTRAVTYRSGAWQRWDAAIPYGQTLAAMTPGRGYWLLATATATWTR